MKAARRAARVQKTRLTHLLWGILPPTVTNAQYFIPNPNFVKSSLTVS
jgi:hypothetical protein